MYIVLINVEAAIKAPMTAVVTSSITNPRDDRGGSARRTPNCSAIDDGVGGFAYTAVY
jgi:hypothetical protein